MKRRQWYMLGMVVVTGILLSVPARILSEDAEIDTIPQDSSSVVETNKDAQTTGDTIPLESPAPVKPKKFASSTVPRNQLVGKRSRANIVHGINRQSRSLRRAYIKSLRDSSMVDGRVSVRFSVVESGQVIHTELIESTVDNEEFEQEVMTTVEGWSFGEIDAPNDTSIVEYPFIFSR